MFLIIDHLQNFNIDISNLQISFYILFKRLKTKETQQTSMYPKLLYFHYFIICILFLLQCELLIVYTMRQYSLYYYMLGSKLYIRWLKSSKRTENKKDHKFSMWCAFQFYCTQYRKRIKEQVLVVKRQTINIEWKRHTQKFARIPYIL
jgi:hypothetical protein